MIRGREQELMQVVGENCLWAHFINIGTVGLEKNVLNHVKIRFSYGIVMQIILSLV
jgi:hypothetical protein